MGHNNPRPNEKPNVDKKAMLQIMREKLGQHVSASAQAAILLVHTARWPDEHPNPLEKFYEWLLRNHQLTVGRPSLGY